MVDKIDDITYNLHPRVRDCQICDKIQTSSQIYFIVLTTIKFLSCANQIAFVE